MVLIRYRLPVRKRSRPIRSLFAAALVMLLGLVSGTPAGAQTDPAGLIGPADAHYQRAARDLRAGDAEAALVELDQAVQVAPDSARVLRLYARALALAGQSTRLNEVLAKLEAIEPLGSVFQYELALASFRAADFAAARDRLGSAASSSPEPGRAYLYLGAAHQELGEFDAAEAAFAQAAFLDPSLAGAVAYRRGVLALQRGLYAQATREFEIVLARLPGGRLAESAQSYIDEIERLGPQRWEVFARTGLGYDSNINLADSNTFESSGEKGWRVLAAAGGVYQFGDDELSLQVGQTFYGHFYTEDGQFDQQSSLTWAWGQMQITENLEADLRYGFEFAWADWKDYRSSHNVEPGVTWQLSQRLAARASFRFEDRTYFFAQPAPFDRTGDVEYAGVDLFWVLPETVPGFENWLRVGYRYRDEDSTGNQFDSTGNQPIFTLAVALPWEVQSVLDLRVEWRDYAVASVYQPTVGPRRDRIAILRAGLERTLWDRVSAEVAYRYTDRDSNVAFFVYDRHEISLMATYRY